MLEHRVNQYFLSIKIVRFFAITLAFGFSFLQILPHEDIIESFAESGRTEMCLFALMSLVFIYVFSFHDLTKSPNYNLPNLKDTTLYAMVVAGLVAVPISLYAHLRFGFFSILQPIFFVLLTPLFFITLRFFFILLFQFINNLEHNRRRVLFVGSNKRILEFSRMLEQDKMLGVENIGFIDDTVAAEASVSLMGDLADFRRIVRGQVVDAAVIHLPVRSYYDEINEILDIADEQGIVTCCLNDYFDRHETNRTFSLMGSVSTITYHTTPPVDWKLLLKRAFDVVVSLVAIVVTLPLMIATAIGILMQDYGPVIFTQKRVGYRKRLFTMYKFRSMYVNAPELSEELRSRNEMDGPCFKIKKDPRIFPFGRFIRKYSIDELPQLFNVLKGSMSIVGPRPMPIEDYRRFKKDWLRRRFSVKPGLTCDWQAKDNRNEIAFEDWMRMDMDYIDNWSLTQDIKIMLKTVCVVLTGQGM